MAESNLAEDLDFNPLEKPQDKPDQNKAEGVDSTDTRHLSPNDIKRMKEQGLSIKDLAREREQLKSQAEAKMKEFVTVRGQRGALITTKEYSDLQRRLDAAKGPEETRKILDEINGIPRQKETAAQQEKDDSVELEPNNPKLLDLQKKFNKICDDNHELIGKGQVAGFKAWLEQERTKTPTAGHLKDLIKRMEGKEVEDRDGLAPRRKEYARLTEIFKKYGLGSPQENAFIKREGLSERQDFRKKIEAFEDHFAKLKDTGFYSPEMVKKHMAELLKAENPQVLAEKLKEAKDIAREESEGFTHLDDRIQIGGVSIRKMSPESKKKFLDYYRNTGMEERKKTLVQKSQQEKGLNFLHNLANGEACLAKHDPKYSETYSTHGVQALDQIYKDNPDALKLALQSFEHLDFMQKVEALKKHAVLAKTAKNKEELERNLIMQGVKASLASAKVKKSISAETEKRYIEFFNKPENFKNPDTKKTGDFKEFKKAYEMLINETPNEQYKNLAAYEARRKKFEKDLKQLQEINPAISDEDLKKWQEKYDKEGWTKRQQIHNQELLPKISKENEDRKKRLGLEEKAGMHGEAIKKSKENAPKLAETLSAATELLNNDQGAEAMKLLLEYNESQPDNPKILFWMQTVANYMKEFGSGKKREATVEKELETELDKIAAGDKGTQDKLLEQQIKSLNMEGVKQSEQRHNRTVSGQERASKESMARVPQGKQGTLEADLTADAYKQLGKDFRVDKEGKAKKIETIQFKDNNLKMQEQDRFRMKRETFKEQTRLDKKEGMFTTMKDKQGNVIAHQVAANLQKAELQRLEEEMAKKAQEKVNARTTSADTQGAKIFDLQTKIAARRKAKELIDKKRGERLKAA